MVELWQDEKSTPNTQVDSLHADSTAGWKHFHCGIADYCATTDIFISLYSYPYSVQLMYALQELNSLC